MIKAVLFDLDGTLLDSAPDLVGSLNFLRAGLGLDAIPVAELRHFVSRGAVGLIKAGMPPCDDETLDGWRREFLRHYAANSYVHSRPFNGVDSMLSELGRRGVPWGIVTNKMESLCIPILQKTGWLATAGSVICGDTVENNKPHPQPVLTACNQIGIEPAHTLMVGDDRRDLEAGVRAGCGIAWALYGYAVSEPLAEFSEHTALLESPDDVLNLLNANVIE